MNSSENSNSAELQPQTNLRPRIISSTGNRKLKYYTETRVSAVLTKQPSSQSHSLLSIFQDDNVFTPDDLNFSLLFPFEQPKQRQFEDPLNIDEQQNLIGFENLPEWEPDELECLLNELEIGVNENATHEPVFDSAQSMKFNFTSVCDVSGINILDDVTPVKVISQPISLQAAIELKQSSSKRKQNLNVTRDGIAEFIEVDDTNARRQLVFDSSNNFQQSISSEQTPEYAKENDPDKTLPSNGKASGMSKSDQTTVRSIKTRKKQSASKKKSSQSQSLDQNYHSTVVGTSTTEITYSRSTSKHGSDRFICICKRTFSSLKSYEEHRKTH